MKLEHDMVYGDFKDLPRRTASDKSVHNKAFNTAKNPKYDGYQRALASMVYKFLDIKSISLADKSVAGSGIKNQIKLKQLAEELQKPTIRKFEDRKVYSSFKDNIGGADLADIQLITKFNIVIVNMFGLFL